MSNYTKLTDFASKDALPSGNANKILKGTEIDDEFEAIENAVSTKADRNSPALTGTPTAPTATPATNSTQVATTAFVATAVTAGLAGADGTGLSESSGVLSIADTSVTAGSYGSVTEIPAITVNAQGQVTAASTNAISISSFGVTADSTAFGNDTTISVPANTIMVSGTCRYYGGGNAGGRLSVQLMQSDNTVIDTLVVGGFNESNGTDGGSGMYSRDAFTFFIPSNCAKVRYYRSSGGNSISGEISQYLTYG